MKRTAWRGTKAMRMKIRGGTVRHGDPSLCLTCRHATWQAGLHFSNAAVATSTLAVRRMSRELAPTRSS
jgi:hypothetical protein